MPRRHKHNLSHYRLFTGDLGQLMPCGLVEVLPGDVFRHSASLLVRVSPLQAPIMHPITARIDHWFVPHRLSWPKDYPVTWEDFITGGKDGDSSNPIPQMTTTGVANDLFDYMGLPTVAGINVSKLPVRAYNLIFNEFYRDQDLVNERAEEATDIAYVSWEKDYHTTARPWPQRGPDVTLPLGDRAPVKGIGKASQSYVDDNAAGVYETGGTGTVQYPKHAKVGDVDGDPHSQWHIQEDDTNAGFPAIWADLTAATAAKVNEVRRAFALQRFAENRARYGARYPEYLRLLGVRPSDARLDRPEFLGGGKQGIAISEVLQSSEGPGGRLGVGDMYGHGISAGRSNFYRRRFNEHGYVVSTVSVRPRHMFTNGVHRTWLRKDREDFWQRELQYIGQQEVLTQEVYATASNQDAVFGFSDRYAEYRRCQSHVSGEFRNVLDYWHLARQFTEAPALNAAFIECKPSKRIFQEQSQHSLWMAMNHSLMARRLVSRSATGRII